MMKFLRSQSQTVLIIVLGVIGLGFLFYGNAGNLLTSQGGHVSSDFGRIDGQDLAVSDLYDAVRDVRDTKIMSGHSEELNAHAQVAEEAWGQLLLLREADRLHIDISDQEFLDYVKSRPYFQKDGAYSPEAYQNVMTQLQRMLRLPPDTGSDPLTGVKEVFETISRNNLRAQAVADALFSTVRSSAQNVATEYEKVAGPTQVSLVSFDPAPFIAAAQVTPDEIEAAYKAHPENPAYRTKEKRKVDYVLYTLTPDQAKLPDAQKEAAKEALGEKALDFALAFQPEPSATPGTAAPPPDFSDEAKKRGLTPATTDFFTADTPPANLPPSPSFNNAAFALAKDNPISKVVEMENGVAVLHLVEIQPSDLLPLDQVKAGIVDELKHTKGLQTAQVQAQLDSQLLKAAVAKGSDFKTAAGGLGLKVETVPVFAPKLVLQDQQSDPRLRTIAYVASSLEPGQVSEPVPLQSDNSAFILHLDNRAKADPAGLADFDALYRTSQDADLRNQVYNDWVNWRSKQPGTHKPPDLDSYGSLD